MSTERVTEMSGERIAELVPGTEPWMRVASASKISVMLEVSPHDTKFSLWHKMNGNVPPDTGAPDEATVRGGIYLEPSVAAWWADQHPEYRVEHGGTWARKDNPRHVASPDRMCVHRETGEWIALEIKTARFEEDWGDEGTDDVPLHYLVQALWQMHVLGVDEVHMPVLTAFFDFKEYLIRREDHADDLIAIVDAVEAFLATLDTGEQPDMFAHNSTYVVLRKLHPEIEMRKESADRALAAQLIEMLKLKKQFADAEIAAKIAVAARMGTAKTIWYDDPIEGNIKLGHRQSNGRGADPYFVPARKLELVQLSPAEEEAE